ncbi:hypothetical protein [Mesorhizobium sp.]|uniref:hypothetical protein n=1 Tax=Mesorhizobium sp. TaxID=1871066 RepID=UPI00120BEB79|nr:hypothetical protein [Mesorhizobium sp.]TIS96493.1 MAG: hypothetical protein E5W87_29445 [Mesorhizobium sp.]
MRLTIICVAIVIAGSTAAVAHEKKVVVGKTVTSACCYLSGTTKKKRGTELDCRSTGTVSGASPKDDSEDESEPRLGFEMVNPGIISIF